MFENNGLRQKLAILIMMRSRLMLEVRSRFSLTMSHSVLLPTKVPTAQEHSCVFNNITCQAETWRRLCKLMTESNFEILLFSPGTLSEVPPFAFAISDDGKRYTYRDETMPATSHLVRADLTCIKPASNFYACACPTSAGSKNDAPLGFQQKKKF